MASVRDIPFDAARQVVDGVRASSVARRSCVRIAIEVEKGAPTALVRAVKEAFVPQTATGLVHVAAFAAGTQVRVNPDCDLAIVLAGTTGAATAAARAFASAAVPCAIVVETSVEVPVREQPAGVEVVAAADDAVLLDKLAAWMAGACHADVALGTNFPFARRAIAERCASERSTKNAVIGLLPFGSSAWPSTSPASMARAPELPALPRLPASLGLPLPPARRPAGSPARFPGLELL